MSVYPLTMPVVRTEDRIVLKHPKGSTAELLLYGATVISWKAGTKPSPTEVDERLFVSSKAALDGSKPVRGGIPIVFPCFGAPSHPEHVKLPQHGFARNEYWKWDGVILDNDTGISVSLKLEPTPAIQAKYERSFLLQYIVTLTEFELGAELHVQNTSSDPMEFQALLHNYIRSLADRVAIRPLQNTHYFDKTEVSEQARSTPKTETRELVDVRKYTDSIYENAKQQYEVIWPGGGISIKAENLKDVVVWNPQEQGSKIGDMETDGWKKYVCVEPGFVRGFVNLGPGKTWVGKQVLSTIT